MVMSYAPGRRAVSSSTSLWPAMPVPTTSIRSRVCRSRCCAVLVRAHEAIAIEHGAPVAAAFLTARGQQTHLRRARRTPPQVSALRVAQRWTAAPKLAPTFDRHGLQTAWITIFVPTLTAHFD